MVAWGPECQCPSLDSISAVDVQLTVLASPGQTSQVVLVGLKLYWPGKHLLQVLNGTLLLPGTSPGMHCLTLTVIVDEFTKSCKHARRCSPVQHDTRCARRRVGAMHTSNGCMPQR